MNVAEPVLQTCLTLLKQLFSEFLDLLTVVVMIAPRSTPPPKAAVLAPTKNHARTAASLDPQEVVEWLSALAHLVPADISKDLKRQVLTRRIDGNHFSALLNTCCLSELEVDNLSTLHQARMRKAWHADYPESASVRLNALRKPERASRRQSYDYLPEQESRPQTFGPSHEQEPRPRSKEPRRSSHPQNEHTFTDDVPADISHRQRRGNDVQVTHRASNVHLVEEDRRSERARHGRESRHFDDSLQNRRDAQRSQQPVDSFETPRGALKPGLGTSEHGSQEAWDQTTRFDQSGRPRSTAEPGSSARGVIGRTQPPIPSSLVVVIVDRLARKAGLDASSALADLQDIIPAALHRELAAVFGQGPFVAECQGNEISGGVPPALVVVVVDRLTRTGRLDQSSAVSELQDVIPGFLHSELLAVFGQNSDHVEARQQVAQRRPSALASSAKRPVNEEKGENACQQTGEANDCLHGHSAHDQHDQHVPDRKSAPREAAIKEQLSEIQQANNQRKSVSRERLRSKSPGKAKKVLFSDQDHEKTPDHSTCPVESNFQCKLPEWAAAAKVKFSSREVAQAAAFGQMLLVSYFARNSEPKLADEHAATQREKIPGFAEPEPELLPDTRSSRPAEEGSPEADELLQKSCLVKVAQVTPHTGSSAAAKTRGRSKGKTSSLASTNRPDAELFQKSSSPVDHQAGDSKPSHSQDSYANMQKNTNSGGKNDEANHSPSQLAEWVRALPPSHLPDKVREELAGSLHLEAVDGKRFTDIAENPSELAKFGVLAPLHAMKVRKAWAQVLREDACRRVAAENFGADSDRKSVKLVV